MLVSNTLFRVGGAAILVSNKWWARWTAKYRLMTTVRVHKGASDEAYYSVYQKEDDQGIRGVALSKDLLKVAGDALKTNLTINGPSVLPWSEQIKFFINFLVRRMEATSGNKKKTPAYVPDFKKAFQHFCIHAGGRAIIDGMQENLKVTFYTC
jgi:3-ketoacyl-CoA synthase